MGLADLFYRYKERGTVEKDGRKFKKYVKVPLLRSQHRRSLVTAALVLATAAVLVAAVRRFAERSPLVSEAAE